MRKSIIEDVVDFKVGTNKTYEALDLFLIGLSESSQNRVQGVTLRLEFFHVPSSCCTSTSIRSLVVNAFDLSFDTVRARAFLIALQMYQQLSR